MANDYDLLDRTLKFANDIIELCKILPKNIINCPLISQVIRSSNSTGANYIEADEAVSRKDFIHKMRIARKEAKESVFHLRGILRASPTFSDKILPLIKEGIEVVKIFSSIINKSAINRIS